MGLHEDYQVSLDAASGGSFMGKTLEAAKHLIEEIASSSLSREEITHAREEIVDVESLSQATEKSLGYVTVTCNTPYPQLLHNPLFKP